MKYTRRYMIERLLVWNPHWKRVTVEKWNPTQLYKIYDEQLIVQTNKIIQSFQKTDYQYHFDF